MKQQKQKQPTNVSSKKKRNRRRQFLVSVPFLQKRNKKLKQLIRSRLFPTFKRTDPRKRHSLKRLHKFILISDQRNFKVSLIRISKFVSLTLGVNIDSQLSHIVRTYEEVAINRGPVDAVKLFKKLYDISLRVITSNDFEPIPFIKADGNGVPKILGPLLPLLHGSLNERRAALHALSVIKLINVNSDDFNVGAIVKDPPVEFNGFNKLFEPGNFFKKIFLSSNIETSLDLKRLKRCFIDVLYTMFPPSLRLERLNKISKFSALHLSGRNGPNGPALTTSIVDFKALLIDKEEGGTLLDSIYSIAVMTNNSELIKLIDGLSAEDLEILNEQDQDILHSKLSVKRESWAKNRLFAIVDYFSQSALKGFHDYLFSLIREWEEDGTFKQDAVAEKVREWTSLKENKDSLSVESADLSEATNAIPLELQAEIVTAIAGAGFSLKWANIASNRKFKLPNGCDVKYNTGQPMGLLSSWAVLAVWHHVMLKTVLLYKGERDSRFPMYYVIGDDVSMVGVDTFLIYKELVNKIQGVGISVSKGFHKTTQHQRNLIPDLGNQPRVAELAKRVFYNGQEVSIIPPDEVITSLEDAVQFHNLLVSLKQRGYPEFEITSLPALTSLCRHKKLALVLATFDEQLRAQIGVTQLALEPPLSNVIWFKPDFDAEEFNETFFGVLMVQLKQVLNSVQGHISNLIRLLMSPDTGVKTKVKGWVYTSKNLIRILEFVHRKSITLFQQATEGLDFDEIFLDDGTFDVTLLKKKIQGLQVVFEIEHLFGEKDISKHQSQGHFVNTFISKCIKESVFLVST